MPDPVTLSPPTQNAIPAVQTSAPDMDAPDPTAGLGGGSSPSTDGLGDLARPTSAPPALANQHSTLNKVLKGVAFALAGAAAGGGEKRPGEAAAAGVKMGIGLVQQGKENARADQATANQTAETQSRIKFQNIQAAEATARAAMYDQQLHNLPQQFQDEHNARTASFMKEMQDMGISPTIVTDNHGTGANAALEQLTASHGGVPHMQIVNLGDKIIGYDLSQLADNNGVRDQVNKISEIQGLGPNAYTGSRWGMIGKEGREQITSKALSFFMPMPTKDTADTLLQQYKNYQQTYAQNPNADPKLKAKLDETVKMLESSRDTFVKQKGQEAASVAQTELPVKAAQAGAEAKARIDAQVNSDDMETNAQMLVEGDKDPSQMSKRSAMYDKEISAANKYSIAKYGKPFDLARAQGDYKFATNVGTQNTMRYLNSLTGRDGSKANLDDVLSLSKQIGNTQFPALNKVEQWTKLQAGNDTIAKYHTAITEVADQVAKIMQGGQAGATSDAKLKQAQELFDTGFNPKQIAGVAGELKSLLGNRKSELIKENRYLEKWFGDKPAAGAPSASAPGAPSAAGNPNPAKPGPPTNLPALVAGNTRILATDGKYHDVPTANLEGAKKIDPKLQVIEQK